MGGGHLFSIYETQLGLSLAPSIACPAIKNLSSALEIGLCKEQQQNRLATTAIGATLSSHNLRKVGIKSNIEATSALAVPIEPSLKVLGVPKLECDLARGIPGLSHSNSLVPVVARPNATTYRLLVPACRYSFPQAHQSVWVQDGGVMPKGRLDQPAADLFQDLRQMLACLDHPNTRPRHGGETNSTRLRQSPVGRLVFAFLLVPGCIITFPGIRKISLFLAPENFVERRPKHL